MKFGMGFLTALFVAVAISVTMAESRDTKPLLTQETKPETANSAAIKSPKSGRDMVTFAAINDRSAGIWVNGGEEHGTRRGAVVGYQAEQGGPYFAIFDTNYKTDHDAHQFAITLQEGKPVIQIAVPGKPIRFIDLDKLADQLIAAEKTAAKK